MRTLTKKGRFIVILVIVILSILMISCNEVIGNDSSETIGETTSKAGSSAFEESSKEATSLAEISIDPIIDKEDLNLIFTESAKTEDSVLMILACGISNGQVLSAEQLGITPEEYNIFELHSGSDDVYDIETDLISVGDELTLYSNLSVKTVTCERVFLRFVMGELPYLFIKIDSAIPEDYHAVCSKKPIAISTCERGAKNATADIDNDGTKEKVELDIERDGSLVHCKVLFEDVLIETKEYSLTANGDTSIFAVGDINSDGLEEVFIRADGIFEAMSAFEVCGLKS